MRSLRSLARALKWKLLSPRTPRLGAGPRYEASRILTKNRIQHVIWFEDALDLWAGDTAAFYCDFYLLVADPEHASFVLKRSGYQLSPWRPVFKNDVPSCIGGIRLSPTGKDDGRTATVLISASHWNYDLRTAVIHPESSLPLPPFVLILESLMRMWLSIRQEDMTKYLVWEGSLACQILYCYYLPVLGDDKVRTVEFAEQLAPEYREIHFDIVGQYPGKKSIHCYQKRQYHAMRSEQIADGLFKPKSYPETTFPPSLAEYPQLTLPIPRRPRRRKREQLSAPEPPTDKDDVAM